MKTTPRKIDKWIDEQPEFTGIPKMEAMKRLMSIHGTPYFVACAIGVYEHAVRRWIKERGWEFARGQWIAPGDQTKEPVR